MPQTVIVIACVAVTEANYCMNVLSLEFRISINVCFIPVELYWPFRHKALKKRDSQWLLDRYSQPTSPQLIEIPSFARSPVAPVRFNLSDPAKSTKWNLAVSVSNSTVAGWVESSSFSSSIWQQNKGTKQLLWNWSRLVQIMWDISTNVHT